MLALVAMAASQSSAIADLATFRDAVATKLLFYPAPASASTLTEWRSTILQREVFLDQLKLFTERIENGSTGAIYRQLAGAYYGVNAIPQEWIERLALRELISEKATDRFDFSNP